MACFLVPPSKGQAPGQMVPTRDPCTPRDPLSSQDTSILSGTPCPPRAPSVLSGTPCPPRDPSILPGTPLSSQDPLSPPRVPVSSEAVLRLGEERPAPPGVQSEPPPLQEDSRPAPRPWGRPGPQTHPGQVKVALHDSSRLNSRAETRVSPRLSGSRAVPPCGLRPTPFITVSALPFSAPTARLILCTCTWHWEHSQWPCGCPGRPRAHLGLCPAGSEAIGKSGQSGRFPPVAEDPPCHRA